VKPLVRAPARRLQIIDLLVCPVELFTRPLACCRIKPRLVHYVASVQATKFHLGFPTRDSAENTETRPSWAVAPEGRPATHCFFFFFFLLRTSRGAERHHLSRSTSVRSRQFSRTDGHSFTAEPENSTMKLSNLISSVSPNSHLAVARFRWPLRCRCDRVQNSCL